MSYNTTFLNESNTLFDLIQGINTVSSGFLAGMILLLVFFITFIAVKQYDTRVSFISASFLSSLTAIFFKYMGFLAWKIAIIPIIMLFISLIVYWITQE